MRSDARTQSVGGSNRRTASRPSGESAPLGVKIIVFLGVIGSLLSAVLGLLLFGAGAGGMLLGTVVIGVAVVQLLVLVGLLGMNAWAHTWAIVLYGIGVVVNLVQVNLLGATVSGIIVLYLLARSDQFGPR